LSISLIFRLLFSRKTREKKTNYNPDNCRWCNSIGAGVSRAVNI